MKKYLLDFRIFTRNKNFRLLFIGQSVSFFGTMVTSVALPFQIYQLTHSTLMVGLLSIAQLLPLVVTALIGGVFADRYHRIKLLVSTEVILALGCLALTYNALLNEPKIWVLFVVAFIMSGFTGLHRPATESIRQQIIPKEEFAEATALSISIVSLLMIAGPALGGVIIASMGIVATYFIDLITFIISLVALLRMTDIPRPKFMRDQSTLDALMSGLKYAKSRQELMGSYFVDFIAMIFGMPNALFPAIAHTHGGAKTLGLLYAAPAVGALLISLFSGWIVHVKSYGKAIAISAALWGVAIILFGLISNMWIALFFLCLAGAFDGISGIFRSTLWNETIPNDYRGRLAGIEMLSYLSGPKLGDAEAGLVAAAFGVTASVVSGGILCVVGVVGCCYLFPKFISYRSKIS